VSLAINAEPLVENFGTLQSTSLDVTYNRSNSANAMDRADTWGGKLQVHAEPQIPASKYLLQMDEAEQDQDGEEQEQDKKRGVEAEEEVHPPEASAIRYWSDINHVYYSEQSIHPLPASTVTSATDAPQSGLNDEEMYSDVVTWNESAEAFQRYESQAELMEGSLRSLVEECDSLQVRVSALHRLLIELVKFLGLPNNLRYPLLWRLYDFVVGATGRRVSKGYQSGF
jgi:hypothetical protein